MTFNHVVTGSCHCAVSSTEKNQDAQEAEKQEEIQAGERLLRQIRQII